MKKLVQIILFIFTGMIYSCENDNSAQEMELKHIEVSPATKQLIESDNQFGFELFRELVAAEETAQNTLISPVSVSLALAMAYNGAADSTREAMEKTLHLEGLTPDEINESYKNLIEELISVDPEVLMEIANSIWYRDGFQVNQDFINTNKEFYDAEVNSLDFADPGAKDIINQWVSDKTHGKIEEILTSIDSAVVMYLINALYFNGTWKYKFDKAQTKEEPFYLPDDTEVSVPMMKMESDLGYYAGDLFQAVELPYGRGNFSMVCLLPNSDATVKDVINGLTDETWNHMVSNFEDRAVDIRLPRFSFEYEKELKEILGIMGMSVAFDPYQADFSNISSSGQLYISKVKHKTMIEVDEKGTQAAAVTAVEISVVSTAGGTFKLQFNRPFVFAIREVTTNTIVFMGKVVKMTDVN